MDMRFSVLWIFGFVQLCYGQSSSSANDRGLLNRRRHQQQQLQSFPCGSYDGYDSVEDDVQGRKFFLAAAAGVGGAALGYHIGMKHQNQPIINNNIYNEYPPPCVIVQSGGHGSGGGGGIGSGGGIIGGILGHHPILSNILQNGVLGNGGLLNGGGGGGLLNGGGGGVGSRQGDINWNRAIRQFNRLVRPITRGFR